MKRWWKPGLLRKAQSPWLLASATYPLAVLLAMLVEPSALGSAWMFPVGYAALLILCFMAPGKMRLTAGVAGGALLMALGAAVLPVGASAAILLLPACYAALLLLGLPMAAWPREREAHAGWSVAGLAGYLLMEALLGRAAQRPVGRLGALNAVAPVVKGGFILFLLLALVSINRSNMTEVAKGRQQVPAGMRRRNTLLTLGLFALALAVASLPWIAQTLRWLWGTIRSGIGALLALLLALIPQGAEPAVDAGEGAPPEMFGMMGEAEETSLLAVVLERAMVIIAAVVLIVLAVIAVRALWRLSRKALRRLIDRLGRFAASAAEDYVDEVTDTRQEEADARIRLPGLRRYFGSGRERLLPPRERIRHRYLRLRWKHPEWAGSATARETLPTGAAGLYELARYSDREVTEQDAQDFADSVRKL